MPLNLSTETLARRCARRPWLTITLWIVFIISALAITFTLLGNALTTEENFTNTPESKQAQNLLEDRLTGPEKDNEIVIIKSDNLTVEDAAFQSYVTDLYEKIMALGSDVITQGYHYYQTGDESLVSSDRHITIMPLTMTGTLDDAADNIDQVLEIISDANTGSGFHAFVTGQASVGHDFQRTAETDLQTGELLGIPIALIILVIVFGAIAAAVLPLAQAIVSIIVALGMTALIGQGFQFSFFIVNMITMMGLALGIDYSLFIVSRYREERKKGIEKIDAITIAGATASRAVLFSGMMVFIALLGMLIVPLSIFLSLGVGAILVVISAMLSSLTLLPAVLGIMGDKVNAIHIPILQRQSIKRFPGLKGNFWEWMAHTVMRHPVVSLIITVGLLAAASYSILDIHIGSAGVSSLPDSYQSKQGFIILNQEFSAGLVAPAEIVVDGDINSESIQDSINKLQNILLSDNAFGPSGVQQNSSGELALISVPVAGDATSDEAIDAVRKLRSEYIPQAFSGVQARVFVGGATAQNIDYFDITDNYMPIIFIFVLGLSFLLLTVVFRSLIVPLKAVIMNLLSVGAAYGLLVLVFQKGVGAGILGFKQVDTIEAWIPLFLFCVLFGLSMDYHVFLLSRIREHYDQTGNNTESVAFGLQSTGHIITGAALIMVVVFAAFAAGDLVMFQQMGFGMAIAVLLDATIVRSVIVPAAMKLLGDKNWYLPSWLNWLPQIRVDK